MKKDLNLKAISAHLQKTFFFDNNDKKTNINGQQDMKAFIRPAILGLIVILLGIFVYQYFKNSNTQEISLENQFAKLEKLNNQSFKSLDYYANVKATKISVSGVSNIYGALNIEDSHVKDMNIYGPLTAQNSYFQDANIYGFAILSTTRFRDLEVYGQLSANKIVVEGDAFVASTVNLHHAQINRMECAGSDINLHNSTIKKITVNGTDAKNPVVNLTESQVDLIKFDGMEGAVILYGDNASVKEVKGGIITRKNLSELKKS
ncbi:MAG TPA: hypothetical protein DIC42_02985 [Holosporales bacterium]|nr:hypothetical protein [Holosporales bacterium]